MRKNANSVVVVGKRMATLLRWSAYVIVFLIGATLWPRLIEWGWHYERTNWGLAVLFIWGCIPITILVVWMISHLIFKCADQLELITDVQQYKNHAQKAAVLGIVATLGSCSMMASGYEPPELLYGIYDIDLQR